VTTSEKVALNADVVGYSRLMADDFDSTKATMDDYHRLVEAQISNSGGTLVNFVGDNFMAVFDKATDAMRTAIAISNDIEARNVDLPKARRAMFRMGLDQGSVSTDGDQWFGETLNVAARIQAMAPEGGVSISGRVYRALDEPELRFRSVGRQDLKNIPGKVEVFEFADLPGGPVGGSQRTKLADPVLAVLPIHVEMVDDRVKASAQIIRDDLIFRLSSIHSLRVVDARDHVASVDQSSSNYTLESGVHQVGGTVRVYARLIDISTFNIVSAQRWSTTVDELLALSDEIADAVARTLEVELVIGEPARLYADIGDPEAIQKVYTGWYHLTSGIPSGWAKAVALFAEVEYQHPDQPYGPSLGAFAVWIGATEGLIDDPERGFDKALELANLGIERGDPSGLSQMVKAAVFMNRGMPDEALDLVEHLEIQRPTCDTTFALAGSVRRYLGDWEESVDLLNTAIRLTPVTKPWYPTVQACSYFLGGRLDLASEMAEAVIEYQPNNLEALLVLAATQAELGLVRRAQATGELIRDRYPSVDIGQWMATRPFQDHAAVERWKADLRTAGILT
jgi:adenylate cyclase